MPISGIAGGKNQSPRPFDSLRSHRSGSVSQESGESKSRCPEEWVTGHADLVGALVLLAGFCWRVWLARATFFNTDEAWHFSVANQQSLADVYHGSLTLAHPPLLEFVLYFWRHLGTSDLMLRLPGVLAGTAFCWIFYKWLSALWCPRIAICGMVLATLLPPMIVLSAELRQYSWLMMFGIAAAYLLERGFAKDSAVWMLASFLCLCLAMLSHYSAFLLAAALGVYAIARIIVERPRATTRAAWVAGEAIEVALAAFLYKTHISKLGKVYRGDPLHRVFDFYLADWYFHPEKQSFARFLWRGTFGVFRFTFGQIAVGQIAAILFLMGIVLLIVDRSEPKKIPSSRLIAVLLISPFVVNWIAVAAGLYPYGRTRQCAYLAIFAIAGVSFAVSRMARVGTLGTLVVALGVVTACHAFGTLQGRDMLPLSEQRHENMDHLIEFIRAHVAPADVIFTDRATSFQLRYYLCAKRTVEFDRTPDGLETFRCPGFRVISTGAYDGELKASTFQEQLDRATAEFSIHADTNFWVVQGGWASGLGESLQRESPEFAEVQPHGFGRYLQIFRLPPHPRPDPSIPQAR